ncbi:uncharacterized protein LAESUDRAFT_727753 [Laetiporus sulphureus 93-53]|uniref:Uncharacterized protein n=1 Tax=Laetiporus sulphureus 93-53 TaxID=1314785 RepID=A0A165DCW2_9APHY|nr:uncharacterized protein LAESUDRAFT_727753 [Laetiporus sulphureus 93-53]KZT04587.1 hypothetical protein LAESUDRAFT_727753 [Laetiporus sulphureus 93-53]
MSTLGARRPYSSEAKGKDPRKPTEDLHDHHKEDPHEHGHEHSHTHSHSHSIFGAMTHTHGPGEEGAGHDAEQIVEALKKGTGDRGSRITIIGLFSNIGLTASKGLAGWYMNSASLLADAGHSASDLLGDLVTLLTWRVSRKPPSERYPYGYGKFEVLGTTAVSLMLTGGALGIGIHSFALLMDALSQTAIDLPSGTVADMLATVAQASHHIPIAHAHEHAHALDPNAAWFAAASVVGKEWLYRVTKRVANEEHSPVLFANAIHHRSDAYSSAVALVAILGTWWFPHLPLDPIGGIMVSILIIRQTRGVLMNALHQLTDGSVSSQTRTILMDALTPLLPSQPTANISTSPAPTSLQTQVANRSESLLGIRDLRAMRSGARMFVDLTADVPRTLNVEETSELERTITDALKKARREVTEVRVKFHPVDADEIVRHHGRENGDEGRHHNHDR